MASPPLYRNGGENQSSLLSLSLSLHLRSPFAYMRLHYLRSASLRALAGPYTHSVAPSDRPPTSLRPPTSPYQTCSPSLLHPCRVVAPRVPNPTTATLRNFISYASLIIRRSFTRFHASPPSFPHPIAAIPLYSRIFREKRRIRSSFLPSAGKKF